MTEPHEAWNEQEGWSEAERVASSMKSQPSKVGSRAFVAIAAGLAFLWGATWALIETAITTNGCAP
jgi:hypothetical protein